MLIFAVYSAASTLRVLHVSRRNLMAPQDLRELGFKEAGGDQEQSPVSPSKAPHQPKEEAQGFVAGLKRFK